MFKFKENVICIGIILVLVRLSEQQAGCDINHRDTSCPDGYCCARDEFLPELVYCKHIAKEHLSCTTKPSEADCPCKAGLYCKPNFQSTFVSLYGKCEKIPTSSSPAPDTSTEHMTPSMGTDMSTGMQMSTDMLMSTDMAMSTGSMASNPAGHSVDHAHGSHGNPSVMPDLTG